MPAAPPLRPRSSDFYRRSALLQQFADGKLAPQPLLTPPNVCTFARVLLVPLFVALWFRAEHAWWASAATAAVFILAALTDWLDGYLARRVRPVAGRGSAVLECPRLRQPGGRTR